MTAPPDGFVPYRRTSVGPARIGDWLTGTATARRTGRRLSFAACEITRADGDRVLAASAVFIAVSGPTVQP